ncbi:MAG: cobalt-precorrin-5B (C(1))-methyltransferase [Nitrospirae bacterium]|nr:cobalt-precorrin-5B (C(1))-methyltransferase [Nitrospirota bacterium]
MASSTKKLRTGFTTGACAAAAAKAATMLLLQSRVPPAPDHVSGGEGKVEYVEIPFPDGSRHAFAIIHPSLTTDQDSPVARASVIKDAGDDPDVTNKAEIIAEARLLPSARPAPPEGEGKGNNEARNTVLIRGGKGVGRVTKPGLSVPVGEPAINPSPREMIKKAVAEALEGYALPDAEVIEITISVPEGEELAKKTLNARLGIIGGISILGTSGIVRPLSAEAWTSSITAAMDVARATGCREVVLSAGRHTYGMARSISGSVSHTSTAWGSLSQRRGISIPRGKSMIFL